MNENCSVLKTADFIGKRWTLNILLELYKGNDQKRRFSELKKTLPKITAKILSARLKELERHNIITRQVDSSSYPIISEYSLSQSGREFIEIIKKIKKWTLCHNINSKHCKTKDCSECEF